jgi:hydrogenase expression/formation protein HypE
MAERGSDLPEVGKISPDIFEEIILPQLGAKSPLVLVGPQHGVDVGIVDIGGGQVMALTTDPFFIVPQYGMARAAWFAVHILASDAATSGLRPTYLTIDLNLPRSITREQLAEMWTTVHRECEKMGMAVVAGHTARYDGTDYPMVGGATVLAIGPKDKYITPAMAQVGDAVVVTKGAAIEATGLFGATFPGLVAERCGAEMAKRAEDLFWQMSVVEDALTAASVGVRDEGVTAMHDATECGVWGGLYEVARASGLGLRVDKERIIVRDEVRAVCDAFGIDPYTSISEGSLILTCRPHKVATVLAALAAKGIQASVVGEILPAEAGLTYVEGGVERPLVHPIVDPFWAAFDRAGRGG